MAVLLSQRIDVGVDGAILILDSRVQSHIASLDDSNAAVYLASQDDVATVFCFREFQDITPNTSPGIKTVSPV
jgi:hypothetical protein